MTGRFFATKKETQLIACHIGKSLFHDFVVSDIRNFVFGLQKLTYTVFAGPETEICYVANYKFLICPLITILLWADAVLY